VSVFLKNGGKINIMKTLKQCKNELAQSEGLKYDSFEDMSENLLSTCPDIIIDRLQRANNLYLKEVIHEIKKKLLESGLNNDFDVLSVDIDLFKEI
jgi:hypothetical protein